jgi:hypothetical protein
MVIILALSAAYVFLLSYPFVFLVIVNDPRNTGSAISSYVGCSKLKDLPLFHGNTYSTF